MLSTKIQEWGIFQESFFLDEVFQYYKYHTLNQFLKSNSIRYEYKLRAICSNNSYCYNFALYMEMCKIFLNMTNFLSIHHLVLYLLCVVNDPKCRSVYFDTFFYLPFVTNDGNEFWSHGNTTRKSYGKMPSIG